AGILADMVTGVQTCALPIFPTRSVPGYAWIMPLSTDARDVHVGAGCLSGTRVSPRELTRTAFAALDVQSVVCACGSRIRLSGPEIGGGPGGERGESGPVVVA